MSHPRLQQQIVLCFIGKEVLSPLFAITENNLLQKMLWKVYFNLSYQ